jgi:flavodoxin
MGVEIYYFSGTGNSLHAAKELQKRIPEAVLVPILGLVNNEIIETGEKRWDLCFRNMLRRFPKLLLAFLRNLM